MQEQPKISIIVPCYNVEKYIEKCIESLETQTLKDYEVLCVDDGATDATPAILEELAKRNPRIKIVHRINGGLSAARNSGMKVAKGKYIGFVDGDDWVDNKMFEELSQALDEHPSSELAMCGVETIFKYRVSVEEKKGYDKYFRIQQFGEFKIDSSFYGINKPCWNKLYRRDFLENNGIIFPEGMNNEDEVFHYFVMSRATHITFVKGDWYKYMRYGTGIIADQEKSYTETNALPDYFTKVWPLLIEYVKRDARYDLLPDMIITLLSKAWAFKGDYTDRFVSTLLHRLDYPTVADYIDINPDSTTRMQLQGLYDMNATEIITDVNLSLLPLASAVIEAVESPKYSFVLPVYNSSRYLIRCFDSILAQTYQNFEVICVNDGSTDCSAELLNNYARLDKRIRVITQENKGAFVTRKVGALAAKGEYILFVDPDDWVDKDLCEQIKAKLSERDVDIVQYAPAVESHGQHYESGYVDGMKAFFDRNNDVLEGGNKALIAECFLHEGILWHYWGKAIRTDVAKKAFAKMPDIHCNFAEDQIAMFYILYFASTLTNIRDKKYHYRLGSGISTKQRDTLNDFDVKLNCFILFEHLARFVEGVYQKSCKEVNDSLKFIKQSMMDNMWKRLLENATDTDIQDWILKWCKKAGTGEVVSYMVDILRMEKYSEGTPSIEKFRNNQNRYQRKYKKHLKTIRLLITLSSILLITNLITFLIYIIN